MDKLEKLIYDVEANSQRLDRLERRVKALTIICMKTDTETAKIENEINELHAIDMEEFNASLPFKE